MRLTVIHGSKPTRFVCTFCGAAFGDRTDLEVHWAGNARCRRNRFSHNATDTKYATNVGAMPICYCGDPGPEHNGLASACDRCPCRTFRLASYLTPDVP